MLRFLIFFAALLALCTAYEKFEVQYQWNYINYTWPSVEAYLAAKNDGSYVEKHNAIAGIKLWKDKMFLTIPRWKNGVPVTLAVTSAEPVDGNLSPNLEPYPSWDMQKLGDCSSFQFVQSMEVDAEGRMWVIDTGRVSTATSEPKAQCPPRLTILDLENGGKVLSSYTFPPEVVDPSTNYLNDIVLEYENGGVAYISNADDVEPSIVVYSLANNTSWKVKDTSMFADSEAVGFKVGNTLFDKSVNIDGIALSPSWSSDERELYFCPLSSFKIFAVPIKVLKDESMRANVKDYVRLVGQKTSQSDGMVMSSKGRLYYGMLADDAVYMWDPQITPNFKYGQRIVARDHETMQWPDSLAFDEKHQLWLVTNRLQKFFSSGINADEVNFRVMKSKVEINYYRYDWNDILSTNDIFDRDRAMPTLFPRIDRVYARATPPKI